MNARTVAQAAVDGDIAGFTVDGSDHCSRCALVRFGSGTLNQLYHAGRAHPYTEFRVCGWCHVSESLTRNAGAVA